MLAGFRKFLLADATRGNKAESTQDGDSSLAESLADPDTFNWCLECVLSRAFQLPPDDAAPLVFDEDDDVPVKAPAVEPGAPEAARMALLPLIDSMNHYSRMPTHMHWENDGAISLAGGGVRVVACTFRNGFSRLYRRVSCSITPGITVYMYSQFSQAHGVYQVVFCTCMYVCARKCICIVTRRATLQLFCISFLNSTAQVQVYCCRSFFKPTQLIWLLVASFDFDATNIPGIMSAAKFQR